MPWASRAPLNSHYFCLFLRYFSRRHRTNFSQIPQALFTELIGLALLFSLARSARTAGIRLPRRALAERGLGGGEACDGNAERRARDVIERNLVPERDGGGVAAVLAADPDLELRLPLPTALHADPHHFAHALAGDGSKRIARENPARHLVSE